MKKKITDIKVRERLAGRSRLGDPIFHDQTLFPPPSLAQNFIPGTKREAPQSWLSGHTLQ